MIRALAFSFVLLGCRPSDPEEDSSPRDTADSAREDTAVTDTQDSGDSGEPCDPPRYEPDPFVDAVVSFTPGTGAGFGQEDMPGIVLGPPQGGGATAGSEHVLTLGEGGEIVLEFLEFVLIDGPGTDLLVFENPFPGWVEPGVVSASEDGSSWVSWDCESDNPADGYPGCAGVKAALSHPDNCIDATDPDTAGGDAYDLAEIGLESARFVRIADAGVSGAGGFDLDAVAIVNGVGQDD